MGLTVEEDIGQMAGAIWYALNTHRELSLARLKKLVEGKGPMFEWAIGWLAREGSATQPPDESETQTILRFELAEDPLAAIDPTASARCVAFGPLCFIEASSTLRRRRCWRSSR